MQKSPLYIDLRRFRSSLQSSKSSPDGAPGTCRQKLTFRVLHLGRNVGCGRQHVSSLAIALGGVWPGSGNRMMLIEFGRFRRTGVLTSLERRGFYRIMADEPMIPGLFDTYTHRFLWPERFRCGLENPLWAAVRTSFRFLKFVAKYAGAHTSCWISRHRRQSCTLMRVCERQIVNYGWQHSRYAASAALEGALRQVCGRDGLDPERIVASFQPMEDPQLSGRRSGYSRAVWGGGEGSC